MAIVWVNSDLILNGVLNGIEPALLVFQIQKPDVALNDPSLIDPETALLWTDHDSGLLYRRIHFPLNCPVLSRPWTGSFWYYTPSLKYPWKHSSVNVSNKYYWNVPDKNVSGIKVENMALDLATK